MEESDGEGFVDQTFDPVEQIDRMISRGLDVNFPAVAIQTLDGGGASHPCIGQTALDLLARGVGRGRRRSLGPAQSIER